MRAAGQDGEDKQVAASFSYLEVVSNRERVARGGFFHAGVFAV